MADLIVDLTIVNQSSFYSHDINLEQPVELSLTPYKFTGTDLMNCMLLEQYKNSPLLITYISAFIAEADILFCEIEKVKLGRMLDYAEGEQLSVIGRILQVDRKLVINGEYFGFDTHDQALSFSELQADGITADPNIGGEFISIADSGYLVLPLSDAVFRNLLKVRAYCVGYYNRKVDNAIFTTDIFEPTAEDLFKIVSIFFTGTYDNYTTDNIILGFSEDSTSVNITLSINTLESKVNILRSISSWFVPITRKFNINLI